MLYFSHLECTVEYAVALGIGGAHSRGWSPPLLLVDLTLFLAPKFFTNRFKVCFVLEIEFCVLKKWSPPPCPT